MKKKIINIDEKNFSRFLKRIYYYKFLSNFNYKFAINCCENEISLLENGELSDDLVVALKIVDILNANTRSEKYNLIVDYACEYLDAIFLKNNLCEFSNDMCVCNRCKEISKRVSSCCESLKDHSICDNFDNVNKCCRIKSIGCKLFVCPYLKKKKINLSVNDVPYLKYFLSFRQKIICKTSIFQDKEVIVDKFLKFYYFF